MTKIDEAFELISAMSLLEARDLVKKIEDEFGVTFDERVTASRVSPRFLEFSGAGQAWGLTEQIVLEVKSPLERSPFMEHVARRVQQAVRACSK